ncbi:MAG: nucleotide exchange factor GrpE [Patescibacteria group bacterium]|jgi:molecular chaperone GrpE
MTKPKDNSKQLKEELEECKSGWIRTQADFDNYRKRTEDQRAEMMTFASANIIQKILPILDHMDLALKHLPKELENNEWAKGILHTKKHFEETLDIEGLSKIPETGQFDPNFHEAISHESSVLPENEIIETTQIGYMFKDRLLRPAKVRVSSGSNS